MFVGGVVVEDDVDQLASRDLALDGIEKAGEFDVAVALHAAANYGAVEHALLTTARLSSLSLATSKKITGAAAVPMHFLRICSLRPLQHIPAPGLDFSVTVVVTQSFGRQSASSSDCSNQLADAGLGRHPLGDH
jgi:hypothetical protein